MASEGKALVDVIVDSIKAYFSINGLILIGLYLIKNPNEAPFGYRYVNYLGGFFAIITGSIVGVWYTVHLAKSFHPGNGAGRWGKAQCAIWVGFVTSAVLTIFAVIAGAITMSCGNVFK